MTKFPSSIDKRITSARQAAAESIDGFHRPKSLEEEINAHCRNVLNGPEGGFVMDYLKSITTSIVMPPSCTDAELRMQEGMRRLVGIMDARRRSTPTEKTDE